MCPSHTAPLWNAFACRIRRASSPASGRCWGEDNRMQLGRFNIEPLSVLLVFIPIGLVLEVIHASPVYVFIVSALAIVPLAGQMGKATEHLAERTGTGIGGLLNATFGNAAELIIALLALHAGLHNVVKASITGSIIGNILLVLGLSMVAGGIKFPVQQFNRTAAAIGSSLLMLSAIGLVVPAIFHYIVKGGMSRWSGA